MPAPIRKGESNAKRQARLKAAVKLGPGQILHFTPGRGYWAGPPVGGARKPPPAAPPTIEEQAATMAKNALAFETAEIERQRALAASRSKADQGAILGLGQAVADMQRGIGPGLQGAYQGASQQIAGLAQGFSGALADRMAAGQGAAVDFAQSQGQPVTQVGPNVTDAKDVAYGLGGYIPGRSLQEQGAAANAWGQALPSITAAAVAGDFRKAMFQARAEDDEFAQQLIAHAAKFPAERDKALDSLRRYEMDKRKAELDSRQVKIQERAQTLYERQFDETRRGNRFDESITRAELALKRKQIEIEGQQLQLDKVEHVAAVKEAEAKGRSVDANASKVYGFIVDKNGNYILDKKGRKIPVAQVKPKGGGDTAEERNPYGAAVEGARELLGEPLEAPELLNGAIPKGKYIARDGEKRQGRGAVFSDGTTNNPARAKTNSTMTFQEALGYVQSRYGLTRARARQALIASGWKPNGQRPPKKSGG